MSYTEFSGGLATQRAAQVRISQPPQESANKLRLQELTLKVAALKKDYAELHSELVEAAQVHRRLSAPRLVRYDSFEIASETFAVRHVPGDLFLIEELGGSVILALSDICGKGLAAGMWTTYLAGLISTQSENTTEPLAIASGVNHDLCRMSSVAPLATLFLARLNLESGRLDYCSAGHPPAMLLRADGKLELLSEGGPLLGVLQQATFDQGSVQLRSGDALLICSDGILESFNEADQEFGNERLETELRKATGASAAGMLFSVLGAVQDFAAPRPLEDDMTLVVLNHI